MTKKQCPLGEDCDLTLAWMMGAEDARDKTKAQIAALEAENNRLKEQCKGLAQAAMNNGQGLIIAESKLAKAVEALDQIAGKAPYADDPYDIARAALAELKGDKT
jgi:myo-inositol-hexaphosphate 3-phosphohydrolase